jgi:UDP-4-amino-4,6-dideoxy-N-acetyl-beta-L-altrosamine transaminase
MIPYARQSISRADIDAVVEALKSDWLTQGPAVPRFEAALAAYAGSRHAVAVSSATAALHLACRALDLGEGDWLWTSPNTFVASANCARYCGANIDFVDIDPITYNMSVAALERKLETARREGRLPKVLVCVHFGGRPCDMPAIARLARPLGIRLVEDASHALGAEHDNRKVGDCACSDITVWSFHPVKIITTGEGGAALTNDEALARRIALLRTHGITRDAAEMQQQPDGPWYYEQIELGFNYRMTEMQAALGVSQLSRVDEFVARRRHLAKRYLERLKALPLRLPAQDGSTRSSWHLFVIQLGQSAAGGSRRAVFEDLRARGIMVNVHYIPVHLQPYYRNLGFRRGDFPQAERFYERAISLPLFYDLTEAQQDQVCETLGELLHG